MSAYTGMRVPADDDTVEVIWKSDLDKLKQEHLEALEKVKKLQAKTGALEQQARGLEELLRQALQKPEPALVPPKEQDEFLLHTAADLWGESTDLDDMSDEEEASEAPQKP